VESRHKNLLGNKLRGEMETLNETDLEHVLSEVINPNDEIIWMSSAIWTFGPRFSAPIHKIGTRILETILNFIGQNRSIIFSSYTSDFSRSRNYDMVKSKPDTGILPTLALTHPKFKRSLNPINNYVVAGKHTPEILSIADKIFWSDEGLMGWAEKQNIRICMLGVPWHEGCSLFHRAEEKFDVPYRYYKRFAGTLLRNESIIGPCEETLLVYPKNIPPIYNWKIIRPLIPNFSHVLTTQNPKIFAESTTAKPIIKAVESILKKNTYGLLENHSEIAIWAEMERDFEIKRLANSEKSIFNNQKI